MFQRELRTSNVGRPDALSRLPGCAARVSGGYQRLAKKTSAKEDRHDAGGQNTHCLTVEREPREPVAAASGHDDQIATCLLRSLISDQNTAHAQISSPHVLASFSPPRDCRQAQAASWAQISPRRPLSRASRY